MMRVMLVSKYVTSILIIIFLMTSPVFARRHQDRWRDDRSSLNFHFGVWDTGDSVGIEVHYSDDPWDNHWSDISVSGVGGFFSYTYRLNPMFAWEFALGGITQTKVTTSSGRYYSRYQSNTHQVTIMPISFGALFFPFPSRSSLRPYASAGIGPYMEVEIITEDDFWGDAVFTDVNITTTAGRFIGGGVDFLVSRHFQLNMDFRYHWVEFHRQKREIRNYSGPQVMWGFKIAF